MLWNSCSGTALHWQPCRYPHRHRLEPQLIWILTECLMILHEFKKAAGLWEGVLRPSPICLPIFSQRLSWDSFSLPPNSEEVWGFAPCLLRTELQNKILDTFSLELAPQNNKESYNSCDSHLFPFCFAVILHGVWDKDLGADTFCYSFHHQYK